MKKFESNNVSIVSRSQQPTKKTTTRKLLQIIITVLNFLSSVFEVPSFLTMLVTMSQIYQ
ncbi:hypothetical protein DERP_001316 [Dermatophagoides pteronyssinus]|uniref:Uncharacterized protein n=1 Tax=Dermatophagoides pteronyssinus TaxID=6956 RepID=A0ABQ8JEM1_DERPT|nr:hypothetical protein DERP_001316 [Dermatophagoides pteronyssinus]